MGHRSLIMFSAESLFKEFSKSTTTAGREVQEFRKLMSDEESLKVLEQAKKSRGENSSGIKPWKVTDVRELLSLRSKPC